MTDPINLLDEASWLDFPAWRDDDPLSACVEDGRTVGDLRRLLALARDAERLRTALSRYGHHDRDCQLAAREPCFCGLNAAALEGTDR